MKHYFIEDSVLSFNGETFTGKNNIWKKVESLGKMRYKIKSIDSQIFLEDGLIIHVSGVFEQNDQFPEHFTEVFLLKRDSEQSYYIINDIFRAI